MARRRVRQAQHKVMRAAGLTAGLLAETDAGKAAEAFHQIALQVQGSMQKEMREYGVPLMALAAVELLARLGAGAIVGEGKAGMDETRSLGGYLAEGIYATWSGAVSGFDREHYENWRGSAVRERTGHGTDGADGTAAAAPDGVGASQPGAVGAGGD